MTEFEHRLPDDHHCEGDDSCDLPAFIRVDAKDGPNGMEYEVEVHRLTVLNVAEVFVRLFDQIMATNMSDDMPPVVAHSRAREYLIQAAEQVSLAPMAAVSLRDLLDQFMEEDDDND